MAERMEILEFIPQGSSMSPAPWLEWYGRSTNNPEELAKVSRQLTADWARQNFNAVGEWINSQPQGYFRDRITLDYATTLATSEPEAAAVWAAQLPEGKDRNALLKRIQTSLKNAAR